MWSPAVLGAEDCCPVVFRESLCGRIQANFPGCTKNCTKLQFEVWLIHHGDGLQLLLRLPSLSLPAALSCVVFFVCAMRCMFSSATCNFHEINKNAFALSKSISKIVIPLHYLEEKILWTKVTFCTADVSAGGTQLSPISFLSLISFLFSGNFSRHYWSPFLIFG